MKPYILSHGSDSWKVTLHAPDDRPAGEGARAEAIILPDDTNTLLVRDRHGRLNTPGAEAQVGESMEDAMIRGVHEQACCQVTSWQLLAYTRTEKATGVDAGLVRVGEMYLARVDLLPWIPADLSIAERVTVAMDRLAETMSVDWVGLEDFSTELVALAQDAMADI